MRVIWSHTGPARAGTVTPQVSDEGVLYLSDEQIELVRQGEALTYEEGDPVAKFVVDAVLNNLASERQAAAEVGE